MRGWRWRWWSEIMKEVGVHCPSPFLPSPTPAAVLPCQSHPLLPNLPEIMPFPPGLTADPPAQMISSFPGRDRDTRRALEVTPGNTWGMITMINNQAPVTPSNERGTTTAHLSTTDRKVEGTISMATPIGMSPIGKPKTHAVSGHCTA